MEQINSHQEEQLSKIPQLINKVEESLALQKQNPNFDVILKIIPWLQQNIENAKILWASNQDISKLQTYLSEYITLVEIPNIQKYEKEIKVLFMQLQEKPDTNKITDTILSLIEWIRLFKEKNVTEESLVELQKLLRELMSLQQRLQLKIETEEAKKKTEKKDEVTERGKQKWEEKIEKKVQNKNKEKGWENLNDIKNIHFTIDDWPYKNDLDIAKKAIETGAKITFFWLWINCFNETWKQFLRNIEAGKNFSDIMKEEEWGIWIEQHLNHKTNNMVKEVMKLSLQFPQNIQIEYHGMFHPHPKNVNIWWVDHYHYEKENIVNKKYLHHLRGQSEKAIQDDIHFFEKVIQAASENAEYHITKVRLPGTNDSKLIREYDYVGKLPIGVEYMGWRHDTFDYKHKGVQSIFWNKQRKWIVLAHSQHFTSKDFLSFN